VRVTDISLLLSRCGIVDWPLYRWCLLCR